MQKVQLNCGGRCLYDDARESPRKREADRELCGEIGGGGVGWRGVEGGLLGGWGGGGGVH